jgi:ABC-type amino acid transport substrate-binding protein
MYDEIEIGNWRLADPAGALTLRPYLLEGRPDTLASAIRRQDDDLKDWVDLYLEKLRNNGELDALLKRFLYTSERALTDE